MSLIVSFPGSSTQDIYSVGGKGYNLCLLADAGFPVPSGFVITAEAYRKWIEGIKWLEKDVAALPLLDQAALQKSCDRLIKKLSKEPLLPELVTRVNESLLALGAKNSVAVRSSSTFEDLGYAAFAGQHDTFLNCSGSKMVLEKIRSCWSSLWGARAVLYRHSLGVAQLEAAMAVVVQLQVQSEISGVAFSLHPVTGSGKVVCIDANFGLGESVVSGEEPVDHFEVEKTTGKIITQTIAQKTHQVISAVSGVQHQSIPDHLQNSPALNMEQLSAVRALAVKSERHFGWPQDIEWAWADGKLQLLQSRSITRIPAQWTRDESAERFPQPSTPLSWDYMFEAFQRSLKWSLPRLGFPAFEGEWFQRQGWYVYGNQNVVNVLTSFSPLSAKTLADLELEVPRLREYYSWILEFPNLWMQNLDTYLLQLGILSAVNLDLLNTQEIYAHLQKLLAAASDYFEPNIAISMSHGLLYKSLYHAIVLAVGRERAAALIDHLLSGLETKTSEVNQQMHKLASLLRKDKQLLEQLRLSGGETLIKSESLFQNSIFYPEFLAFIKLHGHRELFMDYYYPTWSDVPWAPLDLIAAMAEATGDNDTAVRSREGRISFHQARSEIMTLLPDGLKFFFDELIRLTRVFTALDDLEHYQTTRLNPLARNAALVLGRKLVEGGIIAVPEHVFFFSKQELEDCVGGKNILQADILAVRFQEFSKALQSEPPWSFGEDDNAVVSDKALKGLPGSPGQVEAPCFVVKGVADFARFPKGAILIARTTNPTWTPLFYLASAVVTESGGPLSHGAVTAREMGLPAVMGVRGITKLRSGQYVRVNGKMGTVEILD